MPETHAPTALIAEDEPLLAAALQAELTRAWPQLRVLATVGDGHAAVAQALALQPDVLFFDIRMPGQSGLEAATELAERWSSGVDGRPFPALVFVTAYDHYAVQAFDAQAVDYLLKPVQPARLQKTVEKLRQPSAIRSVSAIEIESTLEATLARLSALAAQVTPPDPAATPATMPPAAAPLRTLACSVAGTLGAAVRVVPVSEVLAFDAADKYLRVLTAQAEYLIRTPLKDILPQLDPADFWQIHRGTVVRAEAIDLVERDESGRLHLRLRGTTERFVISRLYTARFRAL
ncbi:MAG: LytTR family DNA-binding domain-containing protein [Tibeticola sp.]